MNHFPHKIACAAVFISLGFSAVADTIYDDAANYNGNVFQMANGLEIGNEISIAPGLWSLTNFAIEYYTPDATLNPNLGIDVRFYLNDGPSMLVISPRPERSFMTAACFTIRQPAIFPETVRIPLTIRVRIFTMEVGAPNLPNGYLLPGDFTFTVTFYNLGGNTIDIPLADDQAGTSYGDYWLYNNLMSQWTLMTNTVPANFVVDFSGVPEPSVFGLGAVGSLLLLGVSRLKRKR